MDYAKLEKSLRHLELQFQNLQHSAKRPELTSLDREALAESVIQRFETCYDTLWKDLKRHLRDVLGVPDVPDSPKPVLRLAAQNQLLGHSVEKWLQYADARTSTAHDYSGEKAAQALLLIKDFIADAGDVYRKLTGQPWS